MSLQGQFLNNALYKYSTHLNSIIVSTQDSTTQPKLKQTNTKQKNPQGKPPNLRAHINSPNTKPGVKALKFTLLQGLGFKTLRAEREGFNTARWAQISGSPLSSNMNHNSTFLASSRSCIVFCSCFFSFWSCIWRSSISWTAPLCSWNLNTSQLCSPISKHLFTVMQTLRLNKNN